MEDKTMTNEKEENTNSQQPALNDDEIAGVAGGEDVWKSVKKHTEK